MKQGVNMQRSQIIPDQLWSAMSSLRASQNQYRSPFFDPGWIRLLARCREDVNLFYGDDASGLAYYWPMHVSPHGRAQGIGGPFSDRNGPVTRKGFRFNIPEFLAKENIRSFTTNGLIAEKLPDTEFLMPVMNNETHLSGDYLDFLAQQTAKHASHYKQLRRLTRKLSADHTDVEFRFDDTRETTFETLIAMKRKQYKQTGRHDVLGPHWVQDMLGHLRRTKTQALQARLSSLYVDGQLAAAELNLQSHKTLHGWIVAYDPAFSKYSPGNIVLHKILEAMPDHGLEYYDSGAGGDHYKKYITNVQYPLGEGCVHAENRPFDLGYLTRSAWMKSENRAPERLSGIMARVRRRSGQIMAAETDFSGRVKGFYHAMNVEI